LGQKIFTHRTVQMCMQAIVTAALHADDRTCTFSYSLTVFPLALSFSYRDPVGHPIQEIQNLPSASLHSFPELAVSMFVVCDETLDSLPLIRDFSYQRIVLSAYV
jgi:hypothetical protein